ncbi:hypothetical protein ACFLYR_06430 [Chloroflexota bacterium]
MNTAFGNLEKELHNQLQAMFLHQKVAASELAGLTIKKNTAAVIEDVIMITIWNRIEKDRLDLLKKDVIRTEQVGETTQLKSVYGSRVIIGLADNDLAQKVVRASNGAAGNVCIKQQDVLIGALEKEVAIMKQAIRELEGQLHPLKIRPSILRTRCELCPQYIDINSLRR